MVAAVTSAKLMGASGESCDAFTRFAMFLLRPVKQIRATFLDNLAVLTV